MNRKITNLAAAVLLPLLAAQPAAAGEKTKVENIVPDEQLERQSGETMRRPQQQGVLDPNRRDPESPGGRSYRSVEDNPNTLSRQSFSPHSPGRSFGGF